MSSTSSAGTLGSGLAGGGDPGQGRKSNIAARGLSVSRSSRYPFKRGVRVGLGLGLRLALFFGFQLNSGRLSPEVVGPARVV
jgi:hypothetical protein